MRIPSNPWHSENACAEIVSIEFPSINCVNPLHDLNDSSRIE